MNEATKAMQEAAKRSIASSAEGGGPSFGIEYTSGFYAGWREAYRICEALCLAQSEAVKSTLELRTEFGQEIARAMMYGAENCATLIRNDMPTQFEECPNCKKDSMQQGVATDPIEYGQPIVEIPARYPIERCAECGASFLTWEGMQARDEIVTAYLKNKLLYK